VLRQKADIRVVVMGENVYAFSFRQTKTNDIDFRRVMNGPGDVEVQHYLLPQQVENDLKDLVYRLGLNFCSADIIVSEDNFYFLDLNPVGQFLFIDDYLETANLCSKFCNFLVSGNSESGMHFDDNSMYVKSGDFADWQARHEGDVPAIDEIVGNEVLY
jgi:hypothetical protein